MKKIEIQVTGDKKKDRDLVDDALRTLKKDIKKIELMKEIRRREYYMSPSKYRKYRQSEAIKRRKRDDRSKDWQSKK